VILSPHRRLCPGNSVSQQRRLRFEETGSAAATFWSLRDSINARGARDLLGHTSFATTEAHYIMGQSRLADRALARIIRDAAN
jgi:hypothetical protein